MNWPVASSSHAVLRTIRKIASADWSVYARRPLFVAGPPQQGVNPLLSLLLPSLADAGYSWLRRLPLEARQPHGALRKPSGPAGLRARYFFVCSEELAPLLLPFAHTMLDRGGRVTVHMQTHSGDTSAALNLLPIAVEVHHLPEQAQWINELQSRALRWADFVIAALALEHYAALAQAIRAARFRLESGFAFAFAGSTLVCGFGACLACVVPTTDGSYTRACVHGPLFPLEQLVR